LILGEQKWGINSYFRETLVPILSGPSISFNGELSRKDLDSTDQPEDGSTEVAVPWRGMEWEDYDGQVGGHSPLFFFAIYRKS
jgi:hypothetical protein